MKTAEEFLDDNRLFEEANNTHLKEVMVKFAKYHTHAALEAAAANAIKLSSTYDTIINAYPLNKIK